MIHKSSLKNHTVKLGHVKLREMIHIQHNSLGIPRKPWLPFHMYGLKVVKGSAILHTKATYEYQISYNHTYDYETPENKEM